MKCTHRGIIARNKNFKETHWWMNIIDVESDMQLKEWKNIDKIIVKYCKVLGMAFPLEKYKQGSLEKLKFEKLLGWKNTQEGHLFQSVNCLNSINVWLSIDRSQTYQ